MKKTLLTCLICASLLGLCSCSGNSPVQTAGSSSEAQNDNGIEQVTLKVWAEEAAFDTMNEMIESFKEAHRGEAEFNITIEQNLDSKTKDVILGDVHNGADVFPLPDDQLSAMAAAGVLSAIPNQEEVSAANTAESVAAASINGVMYAYPMTADNGYFLYYNKKFLNESDVSSLERILEVCEKKNKEFSMEFNSGWYMYSFFGNTGLELGLNDDGVTNYCTWNSTDNSIKGADVVNRMMELTSSPAFVNRADGDLPAALASGKVIAAISGVWNSTDVEKAFGSDYGACKLPTYQVAGKQVQMASFTGFKMMGVNYYSEHLEWAHKLADWFTNEQNQTLSFEKRNIGPANKNAAASDAVSKVAAIQAVIAQSEYGKLQRVGNKFWTPCVEFADNILAGNPSHLSAQKMADNLVKEITASVID